MAGIETSGFNELLSTMDSMYTALTSKVITDRILIKAGEPVLRDMYENAPVGDSFFNARDELEITTKTRFGQRVCFIGITKSDMSTAFYLKFHEWGTVKMPAKPFMQPALEKNRAKIKEILLEELRKELGM